MLVFLHTAQREDLQQIVDYSLRSITIDGNPLTDAPQFPSFETISSGSTIQLTESARGPPRFVLMSTYSHDEYPFTIQYPADWITEEAEDVGARFLSGKMMPYISSPSVEPTMDPTSRLSTSASTNSCPHSNRKTSVTKSFRRRDSVRSVVFRLTWS